MPAIRPTTVLVDARGVEWRASPDYQDHTPNDHGWLLLESTEQEAMTYADVVHDYGFTDRRMGMTRPYLIGYIDD